MKSIKVICLIGILLLVFGCQKKAEEESAEVVEKAEETAEEAISIEEIQAFDYVYLPVTGSYANFEEAVNNLMAAVQEQSVVPAGPMIGIYYDDPEVTPVEELSWEVGFQVAEGTEVQEPLMLKKWEFTRVVKAMHVGPYEETANMYADIFIFMGDKGLTQAGPVMERFLDNPEEVAPEELKTEIWVPVQ